MVTRLRRSRRSGVSARSAPASALVQQAGDEALDHSRLPPVTRNDHDRGDFAGAEIRTPVLEAGEKDGDDREDETLAGASADHKPRFCRGYAGGVLRPVYCW